MTASRRSLQHGFTLIEVIVAMVLIGMLAAVGSNMFYNNMTVSRYIDSWQTGGNEARYALSRVARELREIKKTTSASSTYNITSALTANTSTITFLRSIDNSGTDTTVTITRDGQANTLNIQYGAGTTAKVLASNVTAFSLQFLDSTGAATTSAASVAWIVVNLTVNDTAFGQRFDERLRVALRNS